MLLHGGAARRAAELGVTNVHLSLTHSAESAAAVVVLEGRDARGGGNLDAAGV
jgi:phosphopantetheinyl transferase (holo-ACP synthase)